MSIGTPLRARLWISSWILIVLGGLYFLLARFRGGYPRSIFPSSLAPESESFQIPSKIWQTWHTPTLLLSQEDKSHAQTWQGKNPSYRYELLTDKGAESFVLEKFHNEPLYMDVFLNLTDTILRADFLRYLVLLAEGGIYADMDVECLQPINAWIPPAFQNQANVVLGIESDREPVENDVKLYYDFRKHIWGITNWTFMSKKGHPFMRAVADTVARNLLAIAKEHKQSLSTMDLSYKEVIDSTGPRAFTEAFLTYASTSTGTNVTWANATMLEGPKLIGDILLLPIRAMSIVEADRTGVQGAQSPSWPSAVFHHSVGTWKKTHFQRPGPKSEGRGRSRKSIRKWDDNSFPDPMMSL